MSLVIRASSALLVVLLWSGPSSAQSDVQAPAQAHDQAAFAQLGDGDGRTRSVTVGYQRSFRSLDIDASSHWLFFGEASVGRWYTRAGGIRREFTQVGLTPVVRYAFVPAMSGWFVELGIGLHAITPIFHRGDRRFSTTLNFGDHVAVGTRFGERGADELALRVQHFSNGGVKQPNPGEDFVQLRYARHF